MANEADLATPVYVPVEEIHVGAIREDGRIELTGAPSPGAPVSHFTLVTPESLANLTTEALVRLAEMGVSLGLRRA